VSKVRYYEILYLYNKYEKVKISGTSCTVSLCEIHRSKSLEDVVNHNYCLFYCIVKTIHVRTYMKILDAPSVPAPEICGSGSDLIYCNEEKLEPLFNMKKNEDH
jgi:hypothetical protein